MNKWKEMKWSLHPLFVIVMLLSVLTGNFIELLSLFVIVLIHEAGHVFAAHALGWKVKSIQLLPFGGVVEVDEAVGATAWEEIQVALAGPLQNVWMALLAWGFAEYGVWQTEWAEYIISANIIIALFNLLPIYPLDGGKVALAILSYYVSFYNSLLISSRISLCFSAVLIVYSISYVVTGQAGLKLNLFMIGIFLLFTNWTYYRNIPFLFYRYLINREKNMKHLLNNHSKVQPLIVDGKQSIIQVCRQLKREDLQLICVYKNESSDLKVLPEHQILQYCLSGQYLHRAVGELFR